MLDRYIKTKSFTYIYSALLFAYAIFFIINGWEGYSFYFTRIEVNDYMYMGIQGLVLIASVMLVVSSRLTDAMLPAMILAVLSTACYDSADRFLSPGFLWVAIPAVSAFVFHFIGYRKSFKIGKSFWGLCAVSLAVTLGGIGHISASEYFSGTSLFYVFGLGIGMIIFYVLIKSQMGEDEKQNVARVMYIVGMLAAFSILWAYLLNWDVSIGVGRLLLLQFSNNISTLIMMAMPFVLFYPSRAKRYLDYSAFAFMYAALVFSSSTGGLLFGTIEVLILLAVDCFVCRKGKSAIVQRAVFLGGMAVFFVLVWYFLPDLMCLMRWGKSTESSRIAIVKDLLIAFFESGESRFRLLDRMVRDFTSNPLFGVGLGYKGNVDLYNPVKGAMSWYHMWIPQIVGSLGLVGIAAYGYQLVARVRIYLKNPGSVNRMFFLCYVGLLLMSQVNPGEFCPVPYGMLAVTCFALIERPEDDILLADKFKRGKAALE